MQKRFDLHSHTNFSDGQYSPCKLIQMARNRGLSGLAITDHDTVAGIEEAVECGINNYVEIIPGVEISSRLENNEFHILGLFIDYKNKELIDFLDYLKFARIERAQKIINNLNDLGYAINIDEVLEEANGAPVGRPHIAAILKKKKLVSDFYEAFHKLIGDYAPANELKIEVTIPKALELIHNTGGLAFLAHPGRIEDNILQKILQSGIDGVEVRHPSMGKGFTRRWEKVVSDNKLLKSTGSDFHGGMKNDYDNFGKYFLTEDEVKKIKSHLPNNQKENAY